MKYSQEKRRKLESKLENSRDKYESSTRHVKCLRGEKANWQSKLLSSQEKQNALKEQLLQKKDEVAERESILKGKGEQKRQEEGQLTEAKSNLESDENRLDYLARKMDKSMLAKQKIQDAKDFLSSLTIDQPSDKNLSVNACLEEESNLIGDILMKIED